MDLSRLAFLVAVPGEGDLVAVRRERRIALVAGVAREWNFLQWRLGRFQEPGARAYYSGRRRNRRPSPSACGRPHRLRGTARLGLLLHLLPRPLDLRPAPAAP